MVFDPAPGEPERAVPPGLVPGWIGAGAPYVLTRWLLLRLLGVVYAVAFLALARQVLPLVGSDGLLPAREFLDLVYAHFGSKELAFWRVPTLFWFGAGDGALLCLAWFGFGLSMLVVVGLCNAPLLLLLWALYLSFVHVGQIFYGYGWESLLCEAGFLAVFLAPPWSLRPLDRAPPGAVIVLFRWLLFRVMFGAGLIKIRGDSCWTDLTCLVHHYETQPLPNPLSVYFHTLPLWLEKASVLFNHFVELIVPFGVFGPKRVRRGAGVLIVVFQCLLIASGNLSFLNWLTITVSIACFDDAWLVRLFPWRWRARLTLAPRALSRPRRIVIGALVSLVGVLSLNPIVNMLSPNQSMNASFDPFDLVNTYGAFGSVNRVRHEVVLEGTRAELPGSAADWLEYELPCKPGDPRRRPCFAAPYQYRLDWQMWFAAFQRPEQQPWLIHLVYKLLRGDHVVDPLFAENPFARRPPRYVRARFYRYRFAQQPGRYWRRELVGEYLPPLALGDPALQEYVEQHGWSR